MPPGKRFWPMKKDREPEDGLTSKHFYLYRACKGIPRRERGGKMSDELKKLEQQLLERIDSDDLLEVKKVQRYIKLLELDELCNAQIDAENITTVTENGQQRFEKSHPLLNEKIKLNSQLIALEKTITFVIEALPTTSSTVEGKPGDEDGYNAGDLV